MILFQNFQRQIDGESKGVVEFEGVRPAQLGLSRLPGLGIMSSRIFKPASMVASKRSSSTRMTF